MKNVRVRYAPSPTGNLHIGNTRTALFNFLFAKHYQGSFIVRIEDTDIARNQEGAIESQFDNLKWLGFEIDESIYNPKNYGPYRQLERLDIYQKYVDKLLAEKHAYRCFCTEEELLTEKELQLAQKIIATKYSQKCKHLTLEQVNEKITQKVPFSVRFAVPNSKTYNFDDIVRGNVSFESSDIGDWVIQKNNKIPTYNFAAAIDDFEMKISHVIRGEEHISNTPKQLMVFEAIKQQPPIFAHLTLIVNENNKKLSKRDGNLDQFISQYKEKGFLPEAMFNFISLLGWSPKGEEEIFDKKTLISIFDESRLSKSPSFFDIKKLVWINFQYMKKMDDTTYVNFVKQFLDKDLSEKPNEFILEIISLFKKELEFGSQINELAQIILNPANTKNQETQDHLKDLEYSKDFISSLHKELSNCEWSPVDIKAVIVKLGKDYSLKGKNLFMTTRIFTTNSFQGPELAKVIYLLGKDFVLNNIKKELK
ncbi:glutamate--tRNA ligase [Spiroplasma endosymbiont of Anurida maritima]|uniref:glutamate--tRNA ligase n=1 Tax=Spiroplasma endosymbiont of Anurida maritima TaxID=2967972 RepID=UPI0036D3245B